MHELSLACSLIEEAEKVLVAENAGRATRITVGIGKFSGIERDAFEFAFPIAAGDSKLAGAELQIEEIHALVHCQTCGKKSQPDFPRCNCTFCDSDNVELLKGREFSIQSMEIE